MPNQQVFMLYTASELSPSRDCELQQTVLVPNTCKCYGNNILLNDMQWYWCKTCDLGLITACKSAHRPMVLNDSVQRYQTSFAFQDW